MKIEGQKKKGYHEGMWKIERILRLEVSRLEKGNVILPRRECSKTEERRWKSIEGI